MKEESNTKWKIVKEDCVNEAQLNDVMANTTYFFRVRVIHSDEEGPYSAVSDAITTKQSPAQKLVSVSVEKEGQTTPPKIYAIPVTEIHAARNEKSKTRKLEIGKSRINCFDQYCRICYRYYILSNKKKP